MQNLLPMQNENEKKRISLQDPCPICDEELYLDNKYTQRVGLIDEFDAVIGWLCPHCRTEFDNDEKIINFLGKNFMKGEA